MPLTKLRVVFCLSILGSVMALREAAAAGASAGEAPAVQRSTFGRMPDGTDVELFTLTNQRGAIAKVITSGAILADLRMPDRDGKLASVVREITPSEQGFQRGFANPAAVYGRVANRIAGARFTLDGHEYQVTRNHGAHTLHGGVKNFGRVVWRATPSADPKVASVQLTYL